MAAAHLDEGLTFLLSERGIPQDAMDKIKDTGFTAVNLFALIGDNRTQVRETLKHVLLDPAESGIGGA